MLCVLSLSAMAQSGVLVISDATEYAIGAGQKTFDLTKPCARLTLNAKHTASDVTTDKRLMGDLTIEQYVNGAWEKLYEDNPGIVTEGDITIPIVGTVIGHREISVAYEQLALDLNYRATKIRFSGSLLNEKQIKDLNAYMASFVEVTPANLDFGEMVVWSEPVTKSFCVEHCNVARLSMSSSNAYFVLNAATVANSGVAQYETDTFTVTFTPNIMGQHVATIVVTNGVQTDSIHCRAKVTKRTPILTWNVPETITVGDTIDLPVSSDCDNLFVLSTCTEEVEILCGKLIAKKAGSGTVEVVQLGDDDYWNNKIQEFTVTVEPGMDMPTLTAPISNVPQADRYVRNGQVYIRTSQSEFSIDGKKK